MEKTKALYQEAKRYMPGGVNSPVRAFGSVERVPVFAQSAKGAKLIDVEGKEYIDYIGSWGPLILGHASEVVKEGVLEAIDRGTTYGLPTPIEVEVAKLILQAYPSMDKVRMVNSGTEATMSALRVARGYTKRDKILKFEGCYHGHSDSLLVKAGSGALTFGVPTSSGVPAKVVEDTLVGSFNDIEGVKQIFAHYKGQIAAVIVEPVPGNMGVIKPDIRFLQTLRELTRQDGSILIFDEVITGFRVGYGGAQSLYDIEPDMTCLGKIIGGGLPVGAYGGKKELMDLVAPLGPIYQAGTLSGNPIAARMGYNTLSYLKEHEEVYTHIEEMAILLEEGFKKNLEEVGLGGCVNRVKSMLTLFFYDKEVVSYKEAVASDTKLYAKYFNHMLEEGILLPPSQFEGMFLSFAHTKEDIEKTLEIQRKVFHKLILNNPA